MKNVRAYIDESGDLGFSPKASKTFVIAYVIPKNPERLRKSVRRLRKRLFKKPYKWAEFKFSRDSERVRKGFFSKVINKHDMDIGLTAIEKTAVRPDLRDKKNELYNFLVVNYAIKNLLSYYQPEIIYLVIDRSMGKVLIGKFNEYAKLKAIYKSLERSVWPPRVEIQRTNSMEEPCIQVADYIAGATFAKVEHNDAYYYEMFRSKIKFKDIWGSIQL